MDYALKYQDMGAKIKNIFKNCSLDRCICENTNPEYNEEEIIGNLRLLRELLIRELSWTEVVILEQIVTRIMKERGWIKTDQEDFHILPEWKFTRTPGKFVPVHKRDLNKTYVYVNCCPASGLIEALNEMAVLSKSLYYATFEENKQ